MNSFKCVCSFQIELEFGSVGFCGEGKTGETGEKPLRARERTNNKLDPHMASTPGFELKPHWWEASALTTAPSLLPLSYLLIVNGPKLGSPCHFFSWVSLYSVHKFNVISTIALYK